PLNRRCRRFATPSSTSSCDQVLSDVRTADPGSARKSSVSKSAKVVLGAKAKVNKLRPSHERSLRRALRRLCEQRFLVPLGDGGRGEPLRYFFHPRLFDLVAANKAE